MMKRVLCAALCCWFVPLAAAMAQPYGPGPAPGGGGGGGGSVSITPGTTTILGATAPCFIENSTGTTMACPAQIPSASLAPIIDPVCASWDSTTAVTAQTIDFPIAWSTYTITSVKTKTGGGGSFTAALKIGGTNVTSCNAISVSGATNTNTTCTGANTGSVNDIVSIVISSPSGTVNQAYVCPVFTHSAN